MKNPRSYMREYQRKKRRPHKRELILSKLADMGFINMLSITIEAKYIHHPYLLLCVLGYKPGIYHELNYKREPWQKRRKIKQYLIDEKQVIN